MEDAGQPTSMGERHGAGAVTELMTESGVPGTDEMGLRRRGEVMVGTPDRSVMRGIGTEGMVIEVVRRGGIGTRIEVTEAGRMTEIASGSGGNDLWDVYLSDCSENSWYSRYNRQGRKANVGAGTATATEPTREHKQYATQGPTTYLCT